MEDRMSRVDHITIEERNSGVGRVGPIVGPEVSPFDGVRDVAADIPTTSVALLGGGVRLLLHIFGVLNRLLMVR